MSITGVLRRSQLLSVFVSALAAAICQGQTATAPAASAPAATTDTTAPLKSSEQSKKYVSRAVGVNPEPEPPGYVKTGKQLGLENMDWLEFGLDHRTRYEYRSNNYRLNEFTYEEPFEMRSRGYLGVKDILDPFRFGLEFDDGRVFNNRFPQTTSDVDEYDIYQAFGELYFKDALGTGQPIQFDFGRMAIDYSDRKLVTRSRWRNATDSFDGFRLRLGQSQSDWQLDVFAVKPVQRFMDQLDRPDPDRWFYGVVGAWRKWSSAIQLEPYYFILDEDRRDPGRPDRTIHTMGMRAFGLIPSTALDYDMDAAFQFGDDGERQQRAFACVGDLGYTFTHPWKPRLSWWSAYASGDRNPNDNQNNRFDRLFGDSHGFSMSDLITWSNLISTKIRIEASPLKNLQGLASYGGYWLASDTDAWVVPGRRDPTGRSGTFIGQELELALKYKLDPHMELELGYSHFIPGTFVENTGPAPDSNFFYVSASLRL